MYNKPDTLIIGIGNPFRYDDGVGFFVIDQLEMLKNQNVEIMRVKPDGYSLLEIWDDRELVIMIDAAKGIGPVGTVKHFDALKEDIPSKLSPVSSHSLSLPETIALGKTVNQLPKNLIIFAIEAGDLGYGTELSPEVEEAGLRAAREIEELIKVYQGTSKELEIDV